MMMQNFADDTAIEFNPNAHKTFFNFEINEKLTKDLMLHLVNKEIQFEMEAFNRLQVMCSNTDNKFPMTTKQNISDAYNQALAERKRLFNFIKENSGKDEAYATVLMNYFTITANDIRNSSEHANIYNLKFTDTNTVLMLVMALLGMAFCLGVTRAILFWFN